MTRIEKTFKNLNRPALITYICASDPDFETNLEILKILPGAGADLIEIGMNFTDPMADGPTIQQANIRALENGGSMAKTLEIVKEFRKTNKTTPIILMGYTNPILAYGFKEFCKDASAAKADGLIIVDLPPEEDEELREHTKTYSLDLIRLITPTTNAKRLPKVLEGASGFLYYVSITGITGSASADLSKIAPHITEIKKSTDLPIAVGFGIKTAEDAKNMSKLADAIVVGSSIVTSIEQNLQDKPSIPDIIKTQVQNLTKALKS